jgi:hypothetical protein
MNSCSCRRKLNCLEWVAVSWRLTSPPPVWCDPNRLFYLQTRWKGSMEANKPVSDLCEEHKLSVKELAERSGVEEQRVLAIVMGRWTPDGRLVPASAIRLPRSSA